MSEWETVIGLEIHTQLSTRSKLFSAASTQYGAEPNRQACGIDLALPGVLPVVNREAIRMAVMFGLAVGAKIRTPCVFARKNYFYPDLPRGYQISQYELPIVEGGSVDIELQDGSHRQIELTRAHLEEDAGKLLHEGYAGESAVDLNRAGVPLMEIVSEPQMRSPEEASAYMRTLHGIVTFLGICDGNMEQGSFRCDANISMRRQGEKELGVKVELKNINSFRFVERALRYEQQRQVDALESGKPIIQETRQYDPGTDRTRPMRIKEYADDYRYFPDPDLLPVVVDESIQAELAESLPELPQARRTRLIEQYALAADLAAVLVQSRQWADYFEATVGAGAGAATAARWITGEVFARMRKDSTELAEPPVSADSLAQLLKCIDSGVVSNSAAKEVLAAMWEGEGEAEEIIEARGLRQVGAGADLDQWIDQVIEAHPDEVEQYRGGKDRLLGFFVGQVMKASGGKADPKQVSEQLRTKLQSG